MVSFKTHSVRELQEGVNGELSGRIWYAKLKLDVNNVVYMLKRVSWPQAELIKALSCILLYRSIAVDCGVDDSGGDWR